jgi:hypothetical protein
MSKTNGIVLNETDTACFCSDICYIIMDNIMDKSAP